MSKEVSGLDELAERARFELDCVNYPAREWALPREFDGVPVHDAVIVGGGQNGLAVAFRLLRERVTNIRVLDKSPAGLSGPWVTFARMHTLRTPKTVSGPELGIASLSVRAWYEAKFGKEAWAGLGKIPRGHWHDYIGWLRETVGIDVTHDAEIIDIEPLADGILAVHARIGGTVERVLARNVVLATGIEGSGRWMVPNMIRNALPRERYAHTSEAIDFAALAGKRVAVIGAGASAFDNAAMALEHGAASVVSFVRRKQLPKINPNRWIEFAGFMRHFTDLDDRRKWAFMKTIFDMNQPPPQDTFERCTRFDQFDLHLASPIDAIAFEDDEIRLTTPDGTYAFDFLIVGTGFGVDLAGRPELARFADKIALWSDRYTPEPGEASATMGGYPYLTSNFQFTEKVEGTAPFLKNIFNHTFGAMMSLGGAAGISQLKFSTDRIAYGITRNLFLDDADAYIASLKAYDVAELDTSAFEAKRDPASEAA
ncbi:NAD(P)/FAD-dependent oxidoreductase [Kaistia dalseonensis]|uniref:Cation diffusion facilitator CzcD-associated flavoprotein CzcO n=1 Tax=Kaistia dalseonensis TaxID=410840 RepID=A0ABU0H3R1_9HYPH|nr:NAD(P)/FAD-dependent oxidoreductase [Kaistia dalseonensis]MCX5494357.1 NAD(P)/FAD-dependent oxidoreductase [Kaistia dalseonensis]MDQ0436939.1 cation diffusion facilitator CzcD-associated flavoprotein CzcO [Kaistia dalseonensis]